MARLLLLSAAFAFSTSMAMAAITANDLVSAYQTQGFTMIEVTTGLTQIKVEAVKGFSKVEVIYDSATGAILSQENSFAKRSDRDAGVQLSSSTGDFLNGTGSDNGSGHDMNDDNGNDDGPNHDANDDHGNDDGNDDGPNHDANDDHGNDDNSGHGIGGHDD